MKTLNKNSIWFPDLLEDLLKENSLDGLNNYETFRIPAVNIIESLSNFVIEVAAPGLNKEDFSIELEEDTLKISSKVKVENTDNNQGERIRFQKREFNYSSFERSFKLPENINTDSVHARYENGVLRIKLQKMEEKKILKKMVEIS